ncbi:MAG: hypothetical protein V4692_05125, partial [Bdellovibrionota bacterium]
LPMFANAGNETGNGGDSVASEFIVVATDLAIRIQKAGIKHPLLDLDLLNTAILLTEVYSKERSFLRGREVDAINFPDLVEIQVSRRRWITGTEQFPM